MKFIFISISIGSIGSVFLLKAPQDSIAQSSSTDEDPAVKSKSEVKRINSLAAGSPWWEILGISMTASPDEIKNRRKEILKILGPAALQGDKEINPSMTALSRVNAAVDEAQGKNQGRGFSRNPRPNSSSGSGSRWCSG